VTLRPRLAPGMPLSDVDPSGTQQSRQNFGSWPAWERNGGFRGSGVKYATGIRRLAAGERSHDIVIAAGTACQLHPRTRGLDALQHQSDAMRHSARTRLGCPANDWRIGIASTPPQSPFAPSDPGVTLR